MGARILLTTTVDWPTTARLLAAFAKAGALADALLPGGHVAARSRFLRERFFYDPLFPLASLRRALDDAEPDLVIPCDDRALAQLLRLPERYRPLLDRSLGRRAAYRLLASRSDSIAAARTLGIAAPQTIAVRTEQDLPAALGDVGLPAALKIDGAWGGDGVAIVHNEEQARAAWRRLGQAPSRARSAARAVLRRDAHFLRHVLRPPVPSVSVQAFVPGTAATTTFACWQGKVLAASHMDVLETVRPRGPASVLRRIEDADMEQAAVRLATHFGLSGLHGLDFVRDGAGRPHLIEINARATQASALTLGAGHDLAAALLGCVAPGTRESPALTTNPVIALFPQEWRRDPASRWLHEAYPDVPWDDEAVLVACLAPGQASPERRGRSAALTLRQAIGR
jgi:Carbamoyl-phosphate synthase L chain, ATP binding domain